MDLRADLQVAPSRNRKGIEEEREGGFRIEEHGSAGVPA